MVEYNSHTAEIMDTTETIVKIEKIKSVNIEKINIIGPYEAYRTLGAYIRVDGNFGIHLKVINKKNMDWDKIIKHRPLSKYDRLLAQNALLIIEIIFPVACLYAF